MKPVVIIVIAVVCSVAAVLGVLVVLEQFATMDREQKLMEYEQELAKQKLVDKKMSEIEDLANRELCMQSDLDLYSFDICITNGLEFNIESLLAQCDLWPEWDLNGGDLCKARVWDNYFKLLIPIIEKIPEAERNQLGIDFQGYQQQAEDFSILANSHLIVSEISEEYDNLKPEEYSQQYDFCLTENSEGFCQKRLNSVVYNYCNEKIMFYFDKVSQKDQILCVSKTTHEIVQNKPLTLENSDKIEECKYFWRDASDDFNLVGTCLSER